MASPTTALDVLVVEYQALRDEIMRRMEIQHQFLIISVLSAGALFAAAAQAGNPTVALVYPVIGLFMALNWTVNDRRSRQIGAYIHARIEPHLGFGWEQHYHTIPNPRFFFGTVSFRPSYVATRGIFIGNSVLALVLAGFLAGGRVDTTTIAAGVIGLIATVLVPFILIRDPVPVPVPLPFAPPIPTPRDPAAAPAPGPDA